MRSNIRIAFGRRLWSSCSPSNPNLPIPSRAHKLRRAISSPCFFSVACDIVVRRWLFNAYKLELYFSLRSVLEDDDDPETRSIIDDDRILSTIATINLGVSSAMPIVGIFFLYENLPTISNALRESFLGPFLSGTGSPPPFS